jgi:hypothetical protein
VGADLHMALDQRAPARAHIQLQRFLELLTGVLNQAAARCAAVK